MPNAHLIIHCKSIYYNSDFQIFELPNYDTLKKYDKNSMCDVYDKWPELCKEYYEKNYTQIDFKKVGNIIFYGMGGSGIVGDTLAAILSKTNIQVDVVKGYHLPKTVTSDTLAVMISASGNTVETLTMMKNMKKQGCKIVAFSSGGKMEEYCNKNMIEYRRIPILNSPRSSFPIYLYSILNILQQSIPVKKTDIEESIMYLKKTQKKICFNSNYNPSLDLARWLVGFPMIYYPMGLQSVAIRFKNSLQENAKMHAAAEDVIEASHNGIVAWEAPSNVQPILIQGRDDYVKTKELWKIVKRFFIENDIDYREIHSVEGSILTKIMNLMYMLDYTTIYKSLLRKFDPTPVKSIDYIKNRLT